jgi:hypothetical protein
MRLIVLGYQYDYFPFHGNSLSARQLVTRNFYPVGSAI